MGKIQIYTIIFNNSNFCLIIVIVCIGFIFAKVGNTQKTNKRMNRNETYMKHAIELARRSMRELGGGPFGAIVVKDDKIVGVGMNKVTRKNDPTAHAEVVAIRDACQTLGTFQLTGCVIYSSCEPCPMCLGAIYWARPDGLFFGASKQDAAKVNFDDDFIYKEINKPIDRRELKANQILQDEAVKVFELWENQENKLEY
jgi:guanine deaminase